MKVTSWAEKNHCRHIGLLETKKKRSFSDMGLLDLFFTCSDELLEIMKVVWNCELWLVMIVNDKF